MLSDGANTYLYGLGRLAQQSASGMGYYLPDALYSLRQLVDADGNVRLGRMYKPYGEVLAVAGEGTKSDELPCEWSESYINWVY